MIGLRSEPKSHTEGGFTPPFLERAGVTLIEALVVLSIIGALIGFGMLEFVNAVDRALKRQAREILLSIYTGEQTYFTLYDAYYDADATVPPTWEKLYMDDPKPPDGSVLYTLENVAGTGTTATFVAKATCQKGISSGQQLTLDQTQTFGGAW